MALIYYTGDWTCPYEGGNWQVSGTDCYLYHDSKRDYEGAKERCLELGARLSSVRNVDEMSHIASMYCTSKCLQTSLSICMGINRHCFTLHFPQFF